ncbi:MAG: hypothetical protein HY361_01635 [Candidatus Aenigmarchaeota archaeon]|nr:hypothetical protein [Candidatus Aenigmarchaeota archaeon]
MPICQEGCCFIGSNTFFSSNGECRIKSRDMGLPYDFDTDFENDAECQAELDTRLGRETEGCCVSPDGVCSYGGQSDCSGGDFRRGEACLDIQACGCEIGFACLNEKKDVYEVSSCGDERVVEECNGLTTKCGLVRSGADSSSVTLNRRGSYQWEIGLGDQHIPGATGNIEGVACVPVGCVEGQQFVLDNDQINLFNVEEGNVQQIITISREMLGNIRERKNGESWCISPNEPNEPGSRHFIYRCVEGKILPEPCDPSRLEEGVCRETREREFSEARCVNSDWTKEEALDHPERISYPPSVQFYQGIDLGNPSVENSCGYCNSKEDWWNPLDQCKQNMCTALGDCGFDEEGFGIGGCVKGAVIAEALWLTAGSIAAIGEGEGITVGSKSFANTGWQGFFDTGPLGDLGKTLAQKNIEKNLAENPNLLIDDSIANTLLEKNEMVLSGKDGTLWYKNSDGALNEYHIIPDKLKLKDFGNYKAGRVYKVIAESKLIQAKKIAEGAIIAKTLADFYTEQSNGDVGEEHDEGRETVHGTL